MVLRDDGEATRQRIDALERDLSDARADTARAQAETERAQADTERARLELSQRPTKNVAIERRARAKKEAARDNEPASAAAELLWRPGARLRFRFAMRVLGALTYSATAAFFALRGGLDAIESTWRESGAALGVMLIGAFVFGKIFRAPESYGGALVTLLIAPMVLGALMFLWSTSGWPEILPADPVRMAIQLLGTALVVGVGTFASAAWVVDAASSPIQAD